ncbi:hypothetical protein [Haloarchaeobius baliensis]|uniref:hypothetical protein n=1 Tax=Haloarchaeobius baliensis TaxID=1670458 RepID=UPI003F882837
MTPQLVSGKEQNEPVRRIKGSVDDPINESEIRRERSAILNSLRDQDRVPQSVALNSSPIAEDELLVGYAITVENGVPVEKTFPVKQDIISKTTDNSSQMVQSLVQEQHDRVEVFVENHESRISQRQSRTRSSPNWSFVGAVGTDKWAYFDHEGTTYLAGWADMNVEIYELPSINYDPNTDDNYFACKISMAFQDPAHDGSQGYDSDWPNGSSYYKGPYNNYAEVGMDWNLNDAWNSSDLQQYKPSSGQSGNYSYSASITAAAAPSSTIGVSYDPNDITRNAPDRTGDEVNWSWYFPHTTDPTDAEARWSDTLLSVGSSCKLSQPIDDPRDRDLVDVWYKPEFEGEHIHLDGFSEFPSATPNLNTPIQYRDVET